MKQTMGQEWKNYFHFIFVNCHKPLWQKIERPFYKFDRQNRNTFKGEAIENAGDFNAAVSEDNKIFLEGNLKILSNHFWFLYPNPRIVFFGSHSLHDNIATNEYNLKQDRKT
jgi:hypothetical protein